MENKINIAELLKDCPKGMELDCTMYDNVTFERFDVEQNRCYFKAGPADTFWTTCHGKINGSPFGKCVIFPKGKTTWEDFVPPYKFKDGDILISGFNSCEGNPFIFKQLNSFGNAKCYCAINCYGKLIFNSDNWTFIKGCRFATEEEKAKLFQAIKDNGYKWNPETKTLEKLVETKFKVGDRIKKDKDYISGIVTDIFDDSFKVTYDGGGCSYVQFHCQDNWELVPEKIDISTLKPFDKVLVRDKCSDVWTANFYSHYDATSDRPFVCVGWSEMNEYRYCIPYEANKELLGTTNNIE